MISIVLPVYNEELILRKNTLSIFNYCQKNLVEPWQIVISDNRSTDKTSQISQELIQERSQIKYYHTRHQGKGYGVIEAWQKYSSSIYVYMDIDLATDLSALPELISQIQTGYDISLGSRFVKGAQVERSFNRKIFSFGLRSLLKLLFNLQVKDAPCGFKAINQQILKIIIPQIKNKTWFFDTEMLILAQRQGFKMKEIPVIWHESPQQARKSKVNIISVIKDYLINIYSIYVRK